MTHLGVIWNMKKDNEKQFASLKQKMDEIGSRIARYKGRTRDKITALHYCLRSTLTYRLQFCNWGLDKYEELDLVYNRLVKVITKNSNTYPTTPINCHTNDGGLGIESLSCFAQRCKLRILMKNLDKKDQTGISMQGLVSRSLRFAGQGGLQMPNTTIGMPIGNSTWLSSLIEWLNKLGIKMQVNGMLFQGNGSQILANTSSPDDNYSNFNRGIVLNGEDGHPSNVFDPIPLRIGQCWQLGEEIVEILGFKNENAEVLRWVPSAGKVKIGATIIVLKVNDYRNYPTGLGSRVTVKLTNLMTANTLVERSHDTLGGESCTLRSRVVELRLRTPSDSPRLFPPMSSPGCGIWKGPPPTAIFTDGSWKEKHTLGSFLLNKGEVTKGGAVVLQIGNKLVPIYVDIDISVKSAYEIEMLCLIIAHELARGINITVWSDCKSAISTLNWNAKGFHNQVISGWKREPNIEFGKVKAHVEKRKARHLWDNEETGNWFADQVAGGLIEGYMRVKASDWLRRAASFSTISLVTTDNLPYLGDLAQLWSSVNIQAYKEVRDDDRRKRGFPELWYVSNLSHAHNMLGKNMSMEKRALVQREALGKR